MKINLGERVRQDFPILASSDVVYLDTAASSQKPRVVIDAIRHVYEHSYANIHRGVYRWSSEATAAFEGSREKIRQFINAKSLSEIVFTRGATEAINLVAYSWAREFLSARDEVVITLLEHHSNFVPWQIVAERTGAKLRFAYPNPDGSFDEDCLRSVVSDRTKLIAFTGLSNAIGLKMPVAQIVAIAKEVGAVTLIDAAQLAVHEPIDVQDPLCDVDFLVMSAHKLYGPSGVGVLYGRERLLDSMPPFMSGGDMISSVSVEGTTFNSLPHKFEAGTPNIEGVIGFGAAIDYLSSVGWDEVREHEKYLVNMLMSALNEIPEVSIVGPFGSRVSSPGDAVAATSTLVNPSGLVSFVCKDVHPHDVAQLLDRESVAVRAGHHCAQPLLRFLGAIATTRASFGIYNTPEDVARLVKAVENMLKFFGSRN